ncbi:MAG: hydrolase [Acidobacteria bacterium]|nr:MAG: hydrolase [Acidobacteriota bacterium]
MSSSVPDNRQPTTDNFSPSWWLPGPHSQTVWGRLARPRRAVALRREVLRTPDDDDLVVDHLDQGVTNRSARFVLLHGLEGSSYSVYIQGMLSVIARYGFAATAMNFRSCARDPNRMSQMLMNRRPWLYHSGETGDLDFLIRTLTERDPHTPLVAAGVSLGGNALLKWLGEHPQQRSVIAAATMSVPYDLDAGARQLERGAGRLYVAHFFQTMRAKTLSVVERFPETRPKVDVPGAMRARTFYEFDNASTAPIHGFRDAEDYYTRSSSLPFLRFISIPTLCINAEDDPFLPADVLIRARAAASPSVEFRVTPRGGHTGFIAGATPWRAEYWAEELMVRWVAQQAGR